MTQPALVQELQALEEDLLAPGTRRSAARLDALLADDFVQFGSSGRVWDKAATIAQLAAEGDARRTLTEFAVRVLAPGLVLATYRATRTPAAADAPRAASLRSSIWRLDDGRWQLTFHQGTPC